MMTHCQGTLFAAGGNMNPRLDPLFMIWLGAIALMLGTLGLAMLLRPELVRQVIGRRWKRPPLLGAAPRLYELIFSVVLMICAGAMAGLPLAYIAAGP
jgi:hypothetical protein